METLRAAFVVPLEPEDVFTLSRGIDRVLDDAVDLIAESQVLARAPDAGIAEMADRMGEAMRRIDDAIARARHGRRCGDRARPRRRSRSSSGSRTPTTAAWPGCSRSRTAATGSPAASSTGAARGSASVIVEIAERVMYAVVKQS